MPCLASCKDEERGLLGFDAMCGHWVLGHWRRREEEQSHTACRTGERVERGKTLVTLFKGDAVASIAGWLGLGWAVQDNLQ